MFDLEKSLAAWRHQFKYTRSFRAADLDEMERHLRDQVADLVADGLTPEAAFREAVAEMGGVPDAAREYGKLHWRKARREGALRHELQVGRAMLLSYVRLGWRNLRRDRVPSAINIAGLSIALACCVVVYLFLAAWYSMDSYHEHGDRIFLAQHEVVIEHQREAWGRMPMPLGPALEADVPQVERTVRVNWGVSTIQHDGRAFDERVTFVDVGFFDMLTFPLRAGTPEALADPNAVILSAAAAAKYFGEADPVGQTLEMTFDRRHRETVTVGGVLEPFPSNTGFRFDLLMRFDRQRDLGLADIEDWGSMTAGLLVQVRAPEDAAAVAAQMDRYLPAQNAAAPDWPIASFALDNFADPSPDAYLLRSRIAEAAHPGLAIFFIVVALFMLALSCFNYINIALGLASRRFKEIGMRKVMGGNRRQLVLQFMTENVLLCLLALVLGIVIAKAFLVPLFNAIFVLQIDLSFAGNLGLWAFLVGLLVFVGVASGAYPALYVASFQPIAIFRGRQRLGRQALFTKAFLTFQFVLAFITVILGVAATMNNRYLIRQDWGYDPAPTLVVPLHERAQYKLLRDALAQQPDVLGLAGAAHHVGRSFGRVAVQEDDGGTRTVLRFDVGPDYLQTMGLRLQAGRFFDSERPAEAEEGVVVSERFAQARGWTEAVGQTVRLDSTAYTVVGVVEDFTHFFLALPQPAVFLAAPEPSYAYLVVRMRAGAEEEVEALVDATWARLFPDEVPAWFFQRNVFEQSYQTYNNVAGAFGAISALALLIACLGLFGLASQHIERRMKEIGIRKVVGASVARLALLMNRGFIGLLTLAAAIATAVCVAGLQVLLSAVRESVPINHMPLTPLPFVLAYALVFATAALAVGSQVYRIAAANPAEVLRSE